MRRTRCAAFALVIALAACDRDDPIDDRPAVLARVSGKPLSIADLEGAGAGGVAPAALERAIDARLAADEARRRGLDRVARDGSQSSDEALQQAFYASIHAAIDLPEEDLRAEYQRSVTQLVARQLVLRRRAFASEAEARASGALGPSGSEQIGPLPLESLPVSVLPEALTLSAPGQRVVVARDDRFAVVELIEIRNAEPLSFELARAKLERGLRLRRAHAKYQSEIDRLRRAAEVEIDSAALAAAGTND